MGGGNVFCLVMLSVAKIAQCQITNKKQGLQENAEETDSLTKCITK